MFWSQPFLLIFLQGEVINKIETSNIVVMTDVAKTKFRMITKKGFGGSGSTEVSARWHTHTHTHTLTRTYSLSTHSDFKSPILTRCTTRRCSWKRRISASRTAGSRPLRRATRPDPSACSQRAICSRSRAALQTQARWVVGMWVCVIEIGEN